MSIPQSTRCQVAFKSNAIAHQHRRGSCLKIPRAITEKQLLLSTIRRTDRRLTPTYPLESTSVQLPVKVIQSLKRKLRESVRSSNGILDRTAESALTSLRSGFAGLHPDQQRSVLHGAFALLNTVCPPLKYGSQIHISRLSSCLHGVFDEMQATLVGAAVTLGGEFVQPWRCEQRVTLQLPALDMQCYVVQPGSYQLSDDGRFLTIQYSGTYVVPNAKTKDQLEAWKSSLSSSRVGMDDSGTAGHQHPTTHRYQLIFADSDLVVLDEAKGGMLLLDKRRPPQPPAARSSASVRLEMKV